MSLLHTPHSCGTQNANRPRSLAMRGSRAPALVSGFGNLKSWTACVISESPNEASMIVVLVFVSVAYLLYSQHRLVRPICTCLASTMCKQIPGFLSGLHLDLLISVCLCEDAILACCYTGKFQLLQLCCVRWCSMNTPSYRFNPKWSSAHNFNRRKLATCTSIAPCVSTVDWCFLILQVTPMHSEFLCGYNGHKWYRLHTHKQKIRMTSMKLANT